MSPRNRELPARAGDCGEGNHEADYRSALIRAAGRIRDYQAARGAIGVIRRSLPPSYEFRTLPDEVRNENLRLPEDLSAEGVFSWAQDQAERFRDRLCPQLASDAVARVINERRALLSDERLGAIDEILVWLSGKDLMAALGPWLGGQRATNPGAFRAHLRDWVRDHPEDAITFLPEWSNFIAMLNQ